MFRVTSLELLLSKNNQQHRLIFIIKMSNNPLIVPQAQKQSRDQVQIFKMAKFKQLRTKRYSHLGSILKRKQQTAMQQKR